MGFRPETARALASNPTIPTIPNKRAGPRDPTLPPLKPLKPPFDAELPGARVAVAARILAERHDTARPRRRRSRTSFSTDLRAHGSAGFLRGAVDLGAATRSALTARGASRRGPGTRLTSCGRRPTTRRGPPRASWSALAVSYDTTAPPAPLTAATRRRARAPLERRAVTPAWQAARARATRALARRSRSLSRSSTRRPRPRSSSAHDASGSERACCRRRPTAAGRRRPPPATTHHAWLARGRDDARRSRREARARARVPARSRSARAGWQLGRLHRMSEHCGSPRSRSPAPFRGARFLPARWREPDHRC